MKKKKKKKKKKKLGFCSLFVTSLKHLSLKKKKNNNNNNNKEGRKEGRKEGKKKEGGVNLVRTIEKKGKRWVNGGWILEA